MITYRGATRPASAATVSLADSGVQKWLGQLSPDEQARFTEGLPVFVWGLECAR
jgi:hypothetical protein